MKKLCIGLAFCCQAIVSANLNAETAVSEQLKSAAKVEASNTAPAIEVATLTKTAQNLVAKLQTLNTLKGDFTQEVKDKNGESLQTTQGHFAIKKPGYFKWESLDPYPQLIVGTPDKLWLYDPDLEQVNVHNQEQQSSNNPSVLLSTDFSQAAGDFNITEAKGSFTLSPLDPQSPYKKIVIGFKQDTPSEFSFVDRLGQSTQIIFSKATSNAKIDDATFEFVAPEGTDIIYNE